MEFQLLIKPKNIKNKAFFAFKLSDIVFTMLIKVKMPTIVGILAFMSMINFKLSWVEHETSFKTSGPGQTGHPAEQLGTMYEEKCFRDASNKSTWV